MNIDYSKIITKDLKLLITEERLMAIKDEAELENKYIKRHGLTDYVKEYLSKKADEIANTRAQHKEKNDVEKAILTANIALSDDEKIAEVLLKGNFDKDTLEMYIALLDYVKSKTAKNHKIDSKYANAADTFTKKLLKHFKTMCVGNPTAIIIINRINELLSFKPELLELRSNTHTK